MTPYFVPYVGADYFVGGIFPKRILILGDSHYCGGCDDCGIRGMGDGQGSECSGFTRNVVNGFLEYRQGKRAHERWMNTYFKFEKALAGHETEALESLSIWNSVAFYNYIQTAYVATSRQAYTDSDYIESFPYFIQVLSDLDPDIVIIWGYRLWNHLPGDNWIDGGSIVASGIEEEYGYYVVANGRKVLVLRSIHPSAGFSWDAYGEVFRKAFAL